MLMQRVSELLRLKVAILGVALAPVAALGGGYCDVQYVLLAPKVNSQGFDNNFYYGSAPSVEEEGSLDDALQFSLRLILGYEDDCSGFGGRVRWFTFDNDLGYDGLWNGGSGTISLAGDVNLDVDYIDTEATQRFNACGGCWSLLGSGGVRWGRVAMTNDSVPFVDDVPASVNSATAGTTFEGAGPTVSLEGVRPVGQTGVSLFANGRTSILCGDIDVVSNYYSPVVYRIQNEIVQVWELQVGLRHLLRFDSGCSLQSGVFWEAQRWDSESDALGDLALFGVGIQTGLLF